MIMKQVVSDKKHFGAIFLCKHIQWMNCYKKIESGPEVGLPEYEKDLKNVGFTKTKCNKKLPKNLNWVNFSAMRIFCPTCY